MAYFHSPQIVKDGLVLLLDAGNSKSYPGTGTLWRDLSGNGNNGTLTNGPTFSSANGGSILFDGVNDYANLGSVSSLQVPVVTFVATVKYDSSISTIRFVGGYGNTGVLGYWLAATSTQFTFSFGNGNLYNGASGQVQIAPFNSSINQIAGTFDGTNIKTYLNGNLTNSYVHNLPGFLQYSGLNHGFLVGNADGLNVSRYMYGNIYQLKVYNRVLTASEILQNYNATKGRFGL